MIVHGGAWDIPPVEHTAHQAGCRAAVLAGFAILANGGSAVAAVEAAVTLLEDDPTFDAGVGSHLTQAGVVELDAGMMDGATLQVGAVGAVRTLQNPIQVARRLLDSRHNFLVGTGAEAWAQQQGFSEVEPSRLIVPREQQRYEAHRANNTVSTPRHHLPDGTVGAVAIDQQGNLVAGTSTGGTLFKPVGRVGDSPLPGCGYYADNQAAAVSCTGHGESIIRVQLARSAADFALRFAGDGANDGSNGGQFAAEAAINLLRDRVDGQGGLIMIDRHGQVGLAHNTPHLAHAYLTGDMAAPVVGMRA